MLWMQIDMKQSYDSFMDNHFSYFNIYNSTGGRSINNAQGLEIVKKGTSKWKRLRIQLELVCLRKTAHRLLENEKSGIQHSDAKLS